MEFGATLTLAVVLAMAFSSCVADEVCYEPLGCFPMDSPWQTLLRPLPAPETPEKIQTRFILFTRDSPKPFNVSLRPHVQLKGSSYRGNRPTFFVTHGFTGNADTPWMGELKDVLLEKVDGNVFLTDWGPGAAGPLNYLQVASNVRVVAAELARTIELLEKTYGTDPKDIHLIGHSLGAQVSSYAGKRVKNLGRITALDPAQPGFEGYGREVRLDASDATFVDVIHTDAKPLVPLYGFGMMGAFGDVDFYINGGFEQPGCLLPKEFPPINSLADLATIPVQVIFNLISCPHQRAVRVFIASLRSKDCTFWGHPGNVVENVVGVASRGYLHRYFTPSNEDCTIKSCAPLGLETSKYPARGSFVVATLSNDPYCIREADVDGRMARGLAQLVRGATDTVFEGVGLGSLNKGAIVPKLGGGILGRK